MDELYGGDSLNLSELKEAFGSVWNLSEEKPPVELIGFDTCLMATVDVAAAFSDIGRYLVASEETEPANGWYYSEWVKALAENPQMDGAELGKIICDTYYAGCEAVGTQDNTTLSVTDLSKSNRFWRHMKCSERNVLPLPAKIHHSFHSLPVRHIPARITAGIQKSRAIPTWWT